MVNSDYQIGTIELVVICGVISKILALKSDKFAWLPHCIAPGSKGYGVIIENCVE
jgi:hypothetical protein